MKRMVILSGGQDSVTCLYWALERSSEVVALTFDYGQRHRRELDCAFVKGFNRKNDKKKIANL